MENHHAKAALTPFKARISRRRVLAIKKVLTPTEKRLAREERQRKKAEINEAIEEARRDLWTAAEGLHARFKTKTVRWFYELIISAAAKWREDRDPTRWQAYLHKQARLRDKGTSHVLSNRLCQLIIRPCQMRRHSRQTR